MITVNGRYGTYIVNPLDHYVGQSLIRYGEYCENEVRLLYELIGQTSVVVDIGANVGAITLPLARRARKVYAFEPHPTMYNALCGMLALNDIHNVEAFKIGVGEKTGVMGYQDLDKFEHNNGAHSLVPATDEAHLVHITNQVPACNLMKIDVEGMELEVLKGAKSMIDACQPFIFVENDRKDKYVDLINYVRETLGYTAYWCNWALYAANNFNNNPENIYGNIGCANMFCYPKDMALRMEDFGLQPALASEPHPIQLSQ